MIVLCGRWSWEGHLSKTLGKTLLNIFIIVVFWETAVWVSRIILLGRWSWKDHSLVTLGKTLLYINCSSPLGDKTVWVSRVLLRRWFQIDYSSVTMGKKLCRYIHQVSKKTDLFESVVFLLGRRSWNGYSSVTLGKTLNIHCSGLLGEGALHISNVILKRWFWNGFHWWHWRRFCAFSVNLYHSLDMYVLTKYLYCRPYDCTNNGF